LNAAELEQAIAGDARDGCQVKWSRKKGGPFSTREISAVVAYIQAWNETGGQLDLPELPPYPTATPFPTATPKGGKAGVIEPTYTPQPTLDPQLRLIIEGSTLAQGAWLYTEHCYRCHLGYEYSRMGVGLAVDRVKRTITNGKAGTSMPAFGLSEGGKLRVREINSIVEYIQAWEKLGSQPALPEVLFIPPTPNPESLQMIPLPEIPPVQGQPELGMAIYAEHCVSCHEAGGQGGLGPRLAKDWGSVRADLTIRSTIRQGVPGSAMQAWSQSAGGPLSDEQIDHLVALILAWSAVHAVLPLAETAAATPSAGSGALMSIFFMAALSLGLLASLRTWRNG
jgi:mono/diheme cytochrome c family protein